MSTWLALYHADQISPERMYCSRLRQIYRSVLVRLNVNCYIHHIRRFNIESKTRFSWSDSEEIRDELLNIQVEASLEIVQTIGRLRKAPRTE